jgi:quercetin dioxygenase-like cupin family protein
MIPLLLAFAGLPAQAEDKVPPVHTVVHYSEAPTRTVPSGKAKMIRLAGKEEGAKHAFFAVVELSPGAKVPIHRDATEEYIYMLQGTGEITIDGTTHSVTVGTGVFMPANAAVSFLATGEETVRVVQFFAGQGPETKYDGWAAVPLPGQK